MIPAAALTPALSTPDAPSRARALIEGQMAMLSRLAQMGMDIAEAVRREACGAGTAAGSATDPDTPPTPARPASARELGLVFARVARAVRMTIALQMRLAKDLAALDRDAAYAEADRRVSRRMRLQGLVDEAARTLVEGRRRAEGQYWADDYDAPGDDVEDEIERMAEAAYERLTDAEDGELHGATFDEAVAAICRDLGLSPGGGARIRAAVQPPPGAGAPGHDADAPGDARPEPWPAPPYRFDPDPPSPPPPPPGFAGAGPAVPPRAPP